MPRLIFLIEVLDVLRYEMSGGVAPLGHGKREGPAGDKSRVAGTQETVGGYGVERSGTEPPGSLLSSTAEESLESLQILTYRLDMQPHNSPLPCSG